MASETSKAKAVTVQVWVRPEVNERFAALKDRLGIDKSEFVARLLEWFTSLDERLQMAIVTRDQELIDRLLPSVVGRMIGVPSDVSTKPMHKMNVAELGQVLQAVSEEILVRSQAWEREAANVAASRMKSRK